MSSTEDALLAAICADPADDTARLVFADFLQEMGGKIEDAWARLIRAHIRLGTGTETAGDVPTVQRLTRDYWLKLFAERFGFPVGGAAALVRSASATEWIGFPADGEVILSDWQRGFPNALSVEYLVARERWAVLVERVPFCQLSVGGIEDEAIEDLVTWPRLERLTALELTTWDGRLIARTLGERGVAALARCEALGRLESLRLSFLDVTDRVADIVLGARHLHGLRSLVLRTSSAHPEPSERAWFRLCGRFGPTAVQ